MNYTLITNIDHTGRNEIHCTNRLNEANIFSMLLDKGHWFEKCEAIPQLPRQIPDDTSVIDYTERGEYEIMKAAAQGTPFAKWYLPWDKLQKIHKTPGIVRV